MIYRALFWTALIATSVPAAAQSLGDFYELGDYDYFTQEQEALAPSPATSEARVSNDPENTQSTVARQRPIQSPVQQQAAQGSAAEEARIFARRLREDSADIPASGAAEDIPHYNDGAALSGLYDDPDALEQAGLNAAASSEHYGLVNNPGRVTVTLEPDEFLFAQQIENDPFAFAGGISLSGEDGECRLLPPSPGGYDSYEATCNIGVIPEASAPVCRIPLVVETRELNYFDYVCADDFRSGEALCTPELGQASSSGICVVAESWLVPICNQMGPNGCIEPDAVTVNRYRCTQQVPAQGTATQVTINEYVGESWDESQCQAATGSATCQVESEVCVDSSPQTRVVNGVSLTRSCWEHERTYQCGSFEDASDCADLEGDPGCRFTHEICLDDPQQGNCVIRELYFQCPLPGGGPNPREEYVCDGNIYCINGECEEVQREASNEFGDALVALNTLGQVNGEFDPDTLTVFGGSRETCSKKLFGAVNCCSGRGIPLLTPFLCSAEDRAVDQKDDAGLCHTVGSFCSSRVLGVCTTRRRAYCCFESRLSRILQQQGRPQIGRDWGDPEDEQCTGFTIDEFALLDLSQMDFSEVYQEFADAVRLPDELEATQQIQTRIEQYYETHGGGS